MMTTIGQAKIFKRICNSRFASLWQHAGEYQGQLDIFCCCKSGHEMKHLKYEADLLISDLSQFFVA